MYTNSKIKDDNLTKNLDNVYLRAENSQLNLSSFKDVKDDLEKLTGLLHCSETQAILFSIIFGKSFHNNWVTIDDIAEFLNCSPIKAAACFNDLLQLQKLRLIRRERDSRMEGLSSLRFYITQDVFEAMFRNDGLKTPDMSNLDVVALLARIREIIEERSNNTLTSIEMEEDIEHMLDANKENNLVRQLDNYKLPPEDKFLLLYMCYEALRGYPEVDLGSASNELFSSTRVKFEMHKALVRGTSLLIKYDLVKLEDGLFRNDRSVLLTKKAMDLLFDEELDIVKKKVQKDLISPDAIEEKRLFFAPALQRDLDDLTRILMREQFCEVQMRLEGYHMHKGVAILFHGDPGTGKTESVYQIAKKTGRPLMMVDISQTKSLWYGESEKRVKGIFDQYASLVNDSEVTPVLVFNEADAVLSHRTENKTSAVDQTENAIQNIILNELDNLNGILIATTNLAGNLDKAFERRFLYKIRFERPSCEAMSAIWKDKVPDLIDEESLFLAGNFPLTGGQIDNVARKYLLRQILNGSAPDIEELAKFCREETLEFTRKIGF
ncbi:MAG: ATP-binding protein [Bacteroidetes bacterium]|nr:ATP-binding protein [Bacteroidota bacterium]